jgi:hypothetical protein
MVSRKSLVAAVGATLAAAGLAFAPAAHANRVGFNLSIGGPGYAVSVGNAPYYAPYSYSYGPRHYYHRHYWRPAYAPAPVYVAPPVVYRAPVVVEPAPYYYPGYRY